MGKPIIAVDIDDVLGDENGSIRAFINETYKLNLTPEDYAIEAPYWGYWEHVWKVDEVEGKKRHGEFLVSDHKRRQPALPRATEAIKELEKKYELVIVTSRQDHLVNMTYEWLNKHFPKVFKGVHFVRLWGGGEEVTKAKICEEIGASYLIDDNVEHCSLTAAAGVDTLLFGNYGWNKATELPDRVTRVKDWQEVLEYFDGKN